MASGTCRVCGRAIDPPRWNEGRRVCSQACRGEGVRPLDRELEQALLRLLDSRPAAATVCPSEAARAVRPEDWRPLMERARRAARRLVAEGRAEILQGGRVVDPSTARGPIRVRGRRRGGSAD